MLGGLSKKATYLNEFKSKKDNLVIVDSGDLLNEHYEISESFMETARLKADLIARVYKNLGVAAINVGELELALGMDYLKDLEETYNIPFVSANIVDADNKRPFKPYVIKNMDNFKIGIIGLMGDTTDITSMIRETSGGKLSVLSLLETAQSMVAELKAQKVDFIIALTHHQMGRNWVVARRIDGIDVIVGGHHSQRLENPYQANNTFIVQSGENGQYQGMLEVTIAPDGTVSAENTLEPMGENTPDDPAVRADIDRLNMNITAIYSARLRTDREDEVLLAESCQACHSDAYEVWKNSGHGKSYATLADRSRQFNPDCLVCHTTRFEQPGGFNMELMQAELKNVQCDSCHGDSREHMENPGIVPAGDPGMDSCVKCHTPGRSPNFIRDYEKEWEKIKH